MGETSILKPIIDFAVHSLNDDDHDLNSSLYQNDITQAHSFIINRPKAKSRGSKTTKVKVSVQESQPNDHDQTDVTPYKFTINCMQNNYSNGVYITDMGRSNQDNYDLNS